MLCGFFPDTFIRRHAGTYKYGVPISVFREEYLERKPASTCCWLGITTDLSVVVSNCGYLSRLLAICERWSTLKKLRWTQKWKPHTDDSKAAQQPRTTYSENMWKKIVFLFYRTYVFPERAMYAKWLLNARGPAKPKNEADKSNLLV